MAGRRKNANQKRYQTKRNSDRKQMLLKAFFCCLIFFLLPSLLGLMLGFLLLWCLRIKNPGTW
jgi:uncharacterized Tic20 family protein